MFLMSSKDHKSRPVKKKPVRSARSLAFLLFDLGYRPAFVADVLQIKDTTAFRYHQSWKKQLPMFHGKYLYVKRIYRKLCTHEKGIIAETLACETGAKKDYVMSQLLKPWSLKKLLSGEWREWADSAPETGPFTVIRHQLSKISLLRASEEVNLIITLALDPNYIPDEKIDEDEDD